MLELINITKEYQIRKDKVQTVLKEVNIKFSDSGFVSILGSSGNGKTTLLNIISGLDESFSGRVCFNEQEVVDFERFRRERVGYVFQQFNLIEHLNIVDNIIVSMGDHVENKRDYAKKILKDMGLEESYKKHPRHLSGGQRQRVAIARMIAKDVDIIICDEPTGSLDEETGKNIIEIIKGLSKSKLVLFVTHNRKLAKEYSDRLIVVNKGKIIEDDQSLGDVKLNNKPSDRSYTKNTFWLSVKSLFGRYRYTIKYLLLTTFILLVASMAFILEGEFFKRYMYERSADSGIKSMIIDIDVTYPEKTLQELQSLNHVEYITPYYKEIKLAASNYLFSRISSYTKMEDVTNNDYIKSIITHGRFPEAPDEVLMTKEGVVALFKELNIGGERLQDQYMTGKLSGDYVFKLLSWRKFIVASYGMPRIKVVGLIDDDKIFEDSHKIYFTEGFVDMFEKPEMFEYDQLKVYKEDIYQEMHEEIANQIEQMETISVNEESSKMINGVYRHINSFLEFSKLALYLVIVIGTVSFLSIQFTSLFERKYEIGLYRALGYNKKSILRVLAYEMLMISMMALIIVVITLSLLSLLGVAKLDYYGSYVEILDTLNIGGIVGCLIGITLIFTMIVVTTSRHLILRKSVLSNINDM